MLSGLKRLAVYGWNSAYSTGMSVLTLPLSLVPNFPYRVKYGPLQAPGSFAALNTISAAFSTIPFNCHSKKDQGFELNENDNLQELLTLRPNPLMSASVFKSTLILNALLGDGYAEVERNLNGDVTALWPLPYGSVRPVGFFDDELYYQFLPGGQEDNQEVSTASRSNLIPESRMIHIKQLSPNGFFGINVESNFSALFATATDIDRTIRGYYENGMMTKGILTAEGAITRNDEKGIQERFDQATPGGTSAFRAIVLSGSKFNWIKMNEDFKNVQQEVARRLTNEDFARIFRIPQHMIGVLDKATFSNIDQQSLEFLYYCLWPWVIQIQEELNYKLYSAALRKRRAILADSTRLNSLEFAKRIEAYSAAITAGIMTPAEAREKENMAKIPGTDQLYHGTNLIPNGTDAPTEPGTNPAKPKLKEPKNAIANSN